MALDGRVLQWTEEAYLRFTPPRVTPIYVGAMGPKMLALAGEQADGVLPLLFPPEHYFTVRPADGGKVKPTAIRPWRRWICRLHLGVRWRKTPDAARRVLAHKIAYYGHALSPLILDQLGLTQD